MIRNQPYFSIVIPTRNRAWLLAQALRSALAQTWKDYEIIVSDNDSQDGTEAVVREAAGNNVRYVRTPSSLPMVDNWEFGLQHATGRFVTFLCDDDAIVPDLLETLAQVIESRQAEAVTWSCGGYCHANWSVVEERNTAALPPVSNQVESMPSRPVLQLFYRELWPAAPLPKLLQSCCSMRLLDEIRVRAGRVFVPSCPDVSVAAMTLDAVDRYEHIDRVLVLSGLAQESAGPGAWTKDRATMRKFKEETGELFREVPIHALTGYNNVAETLLRVKKLLGPRMQDVDLDWARYFAYNYDTLSKFERMGADTAAEMEEFHQVLGRHPAELQNAVWSIVKQREANIQTPEWRRRIRKAINNSSLLSQLELRLRPGARKTKPRFLRGEKYGFTNIYECAARIGQLANAGTRQAESRLAVAR